MPYIKEPKRELYKKGLDKIHLIDTPGDLNYLFTMLAQKYMGQHGVSYQTLNDISGALTNANLELYRRVAAEYENKKILENGDVY